MQKLFLIIRPWVLSYAKMVSFGAPQLTSPDNSASGQPHYKLWPDFVLQFQCLGCYSFLCQRMEVKASTPANWYFFLLEPCLVKLLGNCFLQIWDSALLLENEVLIQKQQLGLKENQVLLPDLFNDEIHLPQQVYLPVLTLSITNLFANIQQLFFHGSPWCFLPVFRLFRYHSLPPLLDFSSSPALLLFSHYAPFWLYRYLQPESVLIVPLYRLLNIFNMTPDRYLAYISG